MLPYGVPKRVGNSWPCTQSLAEGQLGPGVPVPSTRVPDALLLARANRTGSRAPSSPTSSGCLILFPLLPPLLHKQAEPRACLSPSTKAILPLLEAQGLGWVLSLRNMVGAINRGLGTAGATDGIPGMLH